MADVTFTCIDATTDPFAASPVLVFRLRIEETTGTPIHAMALRAQFRMEPFRRSYNEAEAEALLDLFGERPRWGETVKPMQLAYVTQMVPGFTGSIEIDLPMPCSYDFEVAAHKYLHALQGGNVPLLMLFNGTIFTGRPGTAGGISVLPVPWHKEANFALPVAAWRQTMDQHFPGTAWLRIRRDTFDALHMYRARNALVSWEDAIEALLKEAEA